MPTPTPTLIATVTLDRTRVFRLVRVEDDGDDPTLHIEFRSTDRLGTETWFPSSARDHERVLEAYALGGDNVIRPAASAPARTLRELADWCERHRIGDFDVLSLGVHELYDTARLAAHVSDRTWVRLGLIAPEVGDSATQVLDGVEVSAYWPKRSDLHEVA